MNRAEKIQMLEGIARGQITIPELSSQALKPLTEDEWQKVERSSLISIEQSKKVDELYDRAARQGNEWEGALNDEEWNYINQWFQTVELIIDRKI